MKLDCVCGGWTAQERREQNHATRPIAWHCERASCTRRVCTACEGTVEEIPALDRVCDDCWEPIRVLLEVLMLRLGVA